MGERERRRRHVHRSSDTLFFSLASLQDRHSEFKRSRGVILVYYSQTCGWKLRPRHGGAFSILGRSCSSAGRFGHNSALFGRPSACPIRAEYLPSQLPDGILPSKKRVGGGRETPQRRLEWPFPCTGQRIRSERALTFILFYN